MPNDLITLKALAKELENSLSSGRIDKITMPSEEELVLTIRARGANHNLFISCRSDMPRIYLSLGKYHNSPVPTTFCMIIRKYLYGSSVQSIRTLNEDRLVELCLISRNELNDIAVYRLIVEIMGGASNIVLTDENYKIIDAVKRIMNEKSRTVFPHAPYTYPARNKKLLSDIGENEDWLSVEEDKRIKAVYGAINGLSKESAAELLTLGKDIGYRQAAARLDDLYSYHGYAPQLLVDESGNKTGFFAYPYESKKASGNFVACRSLSEAMEEYYRAGAEEAKKARDTLKLNRKLKSLRAKAEKRLKESEAVIESSADKERYRELGEILKCNYHRLERGMSIIICDDFYNTQEQKSVEIALDSTISPQKNIERYFKKYAKAKGAESYSIAEAERMKELLIYLETIEAAIQNCSTDNEYKEIGSELDKLSGNRKTSSAKNPKEPKKTPPLKLEISGYTVYLGKNNYQNEEVTFSIAEGGDIWLHVKNYHGAHGIIIARGGEVPIGVIEKAAEAVAYYSIAKDSPSVEVDYTRRKFVKKAGRIGLVHYTNYKTVVVKPRKLD